MGHSSVEDPAPPKTAASRRLPPPRPLPVAHPVTTAPPVTRALAVAVPTRTTVIAPQPLAIAASTGRKSSADVTQIVAPLPPPVASQAWGVGDRPSSPRAIAQPAAAPRTAEAPAAGASTREPVGSPWAEIRSGRVAYHFIRVPDPSEAPRLTAGAPRTAPLAPRIRPRTAAVGAAALIAAILVVAIGFSSGELPRARAATELDHALPAPTLSASPDHDPATAPATPAAAAGSARAAEPAGAQAARPLSASSPSDEPRPAAPSLAPRPRPRSPAVSRGRATREPGHGKTAGHAHAPGARPVTYDPDALFLDPR